MNNLKEAVAAVPWDDSAKCKDAIDGLAETNAAAFGLLRTDRPSLDEFLFTTALDERSLRAWVEGGSTQDRAFRAAIEQGWSQGPALDGGLRIDGRQPAGELHALWICAPETLDGRQRWCGCFLRAGEPFGGAERESLEWQVRLWQARFNNPGEEGLSYMLVGSDQRLIHADPALRLRLLTGEMSPRRVISELNVVRDQRWPDAAPDERHDAALPIGSDSMWVCFRTRGVLDAPEARHTLVELRPLENGELPPVGPIEDERVARALGYLHDHFNEGPTLTELAGVVDVSPFHFHRVFTRHVGVSPKQYQLLKQLQVAKWRLRCGREPIGAIAEKVGFANHAHFTSTFRRMLGVSPTEYQRKMAEGSGDNGAKA